MIIDTHAHLYAEEFSEDQTEVFTRAVAAGVHYFLLPNINSESIPLMEKLIKEQKNTIPMMGLHPSYVKENWMEELKIIETHLFKNPSKYCAVGEIGMDLFWDKTFIEAQKIVFRTQISWAKKLKLPIAIHARDAFDEIFEILDEETYRKVVAIELGVDRLAEEMPEIQNYDQTLVADDTRALKEKAEKFLDDEEDVKLLEDPDEVIEDSEEEEEEEE